MVHCSTVDSLFGTITSIMKLGKRGWTIAGLLLLGGLLACVFWPHPSAIKWTYRFNSSASSPPVVGLDGSIYAGTRQGDLIAISPDGTKKWSVNIGLGFVSEAVLGSTNRIYVSFANIGRFGGIVSLGLDGSINWIYRDGEPVWAPPVVAADGTVYFGGQSSNLFALNSDGTLRWRFPAGSPVNCSPVIGADGNIAFVSHNGHFRVLSAGGSEILESKLESQSITAALAQSPNGNWVVTFGSRVISLERDGSQKWATNLKDIPTGGTNSPLAAFVQGLPQFTSEGEIHLSAANGFLYTLAANGAPKWAIAKGWRAMPSKVSDFSMLRDQGLLVSIEDSFLAPANGTAMALGTKGAAIVRVDAGGRELWRLVLPSTFDLLEVLNPSNLKQNRQLGFGLRSYQGLSRPVFGSDGTVYCTSFDGLHAIRPPTAK